MGFVWLCQDRARPPPGCPTKWQRLGGAAPGLVWGQHRSRAPGEGSRIARGQARKGRQWARRDPTALGTAYLEKPRAEPEQARGAALPGAGPSGADVPGPQPGSSEPRSSHEHRLSSPCRTALGSPSASPAGEGEEPRSVFLSLSPCQALHSAEGPSWGLPCCQDEQSSPLLHQGSKQDALCYCPVCKAELRASSPLPVLTGTSC